jgi:hypothetical protein
MTTSGKVLMIVSGVLILGLGGRAAIGLMSRPNDQQLIEVALDESIQASKEGRPGGVMDKLSTNLKFNDMDTSSNRRQIADYIKNSRPDVDVLDKTAVITGEEARIVSPVKLTINLLGERTMDLDEVTMIFRKEEDRAYVLFPTRKWKLSEVRVPEQNVADFLY